MKYFSFIVAAVLGMAANVQAFFNPNFDPQFDSVYTQDFTTDTIHTKYELGPIGHAGIGTAFGIFGCLFIFGNIMVIIDEVRRHKDYDKRINDARKQTERYGLVPSEIETDFYKSGKLEAANKLLKGHD